MKWKDRPESENVVDLRDRTSLTGRHRAGMHTLATMGSIYANIPKTARFVLRRFLPSDEPTPIGSGPLARKLRNK